MNIFDHINEWIQNVEFSLVNLVSTIAPWLAPLAPAYLSYYHMLDILKFPVWVSLSLAAVVEMLGLATISTSLMFWNHNRRYSADKNKVPVAIPLFSFFFYLGIVLTINVMLEIDPGAVVLSKALLTLLTIPAASTLAVRSLHREKQEGLKKPPKKSKENLPKVSGNLPQYRDWRNVPHDERMKIAVMSPKDITTSYSVSARTARNWINQAEEYANTFVYNGD